MADCQLLAGGVPLTMMMNMERRQGEEKPVIKKALVTLDGKPFNSFTSQRDAWSIDTCFCIQGAIQYFGPPEICDQPPLTLQLEKNKEKK